MERIGRYTQLLVCICFVLLTVLSVVKVTKADSMCTECQAMVQYVGGAQPVQCLNYCKRVWPTFDCNFICERIGELRGVGKEPCVVLGYCHHKYDNFPQDAPESRIDVSEQVYSKKSSSSLQRQESALKIKEEEVRASLKSLEAERSKLEYMQDEFEKEKAEWRRTLSSELVSQVSQTMSTTLNAELRQLQNTLKKDIASLSERMKDMEKMRVEYVTRPDYTGEHQAPSSHNGKVRRPDQTTQESNSRSTYGREMNYEHHPSPPPRELTDEPREGTLNSVLKIDIDANKESDGQPLYEEASSSGNMSAMSGYVDNGLGPGSYFTLMYIFENPSLLLAIMAWFGSYMGVDKLQEYLLRIDDREDFDTMERDFYIGRTIHSVYILGKCVIFLHFARSAVPGFANAFLPWDLPLLSLSNGLYWPSSIVAERSLKIIIASEIGYRTADLIGQMKHASISRFSLGLMLPAIRGLLITCTVLLSARQSWTLLAIFFMIYEAVQIPERFIVALVSQVESLEEYMARDAFCGFGELSLVYLLFRMYTHLQFGSSGLRLFILLNALIAVERTYFYLKPLLKRNFEKLTRPKHD